MKKHVLVVLDNTKKQVLRDAIMQKKKRKALWERTNFFLHPDVRKKNMNVSLRVFILTQSNEYTRRTLFNSAVLLGMDFLSLYVLLCKFELIH